MPSPLLLHADTSSPGTRKKSGLRRFDIQGMRGVALLMILAYHAGLPIPGGFVCVDVFFVISGFVITGMLQREWATTGTVRFRAFYLRRFKRLVPSLAVVVTVTMIGSAFLLSPFGGQQTAAGTGIGAMFLLANVVIAHTSGGYFAAPAAGNPLLTTWSLSVEEQFYLVFPAVLVLTWVLARRSIRLRRISVVVVGGACGVSFLLAVVGSVGVAVSPANWLWLFGYYSSMTRAWEFAVGALLALAGSRITVNSRTVALWLGLAGCVLLIGAMALLHGSVQFPGPWTLVPVAATVLLIVAGSEQSNLVTRTLATRPLVELGNWSYSVYLWHWPLIVFAAALWPGNHTALVLAAAVSFGPALACYRWVEQPMRHLPPMSRPRLVRFVAAVMIPPVLAATAVLVGVGVGWGSDVVRQAQQEAATAHPGWMNCMSQQGSGGPGPLDPAACRFNPAATGPPIFLVGDSTASMYTEAAIGAATRLGRPLTITTSGGCPFIDVYRGTTADVGPPNAACRSYYEDTMAGLLREPAGVVVIAEGSGYWSSPGLTVGRSPTAMTADLQERSLVLEEGLRATVDALRLAGLQVVLIKPTYTFDNPATPVAPQSCSLLPLVTGQCPVAVPVSAAERHQEQARAVIDRVGTDTGAGVVDVLEYQCPAGWCGATSNGVAVYMDTAHLSAPLSALLAPEFGRAIAAAG